MTDNETLAQATRRRPVQVTAAGMRQQVCGHDECKAQRLSRPDGQSWRPCWLCGAADAPIGRRP